MEIQKDLGQLSDQIGLARQLLNLEASLMVLFYEKKRRDQGFISCQKWIPIAADLQSTLVRPNAYAID